MKAHLIMTLLTALYLLTACGGDQTGTSDGDTPPDPGTIGATCDPSQPETCSETLSCDVLSSSCVYPFEEDGDGETTGEETEDPPGCDYNDEFQNFLMCGYKDWVPTENVFSIQYCDHTTVSYDYSEVCGTAMNTAADELPQTKLTSDYSLTRLRNMLDICCATYYRIYVPEEYFWIEGDWICDPNQPSACGDLLDDGEFSTIKVTAWDGDEKGAKISIKLSNRVNFWSMLDFNIKSNSNGIYSLYAPEVFEPELDSLLSAAGQAAFADGTITLTITEKQTGTATNFVSSYALIKPQ